MVTNCIAAIILNSFLLPMTEEVHVCTSQRTISAYVMYCSKSDRGVNAFIEVLTEWPR